MKAGCPFVRSVTQASSCCTLVRCGNMTACGCPDTIPICYIVPKYVIPIDFNELCIGTFNSIHQHALR